MILHEPRQPICHPLRSRPGGGWGWRGLVVSLTLHGGLVWAAFHIGWGGQGNGGADLLGREAGADEGTLTTLEMQVARPVNPVPEPVRTQPASIVPKALRPRQAPPALLRPLQRLTVARPTENLTLPDAAPSRLPASIALPESIVASAAPAAQAPAAPSVREARKGDSGRASGKGGQGRAGEATFSSSPPRLVSAKPPAYPSAARRAGAEGVATVRVSVSATGKVLGCAIFRSAGREDLDAAALKAVRNWEFQPGRQASGAVAADVLVRVVFRLA